MSVKNNHKKLAFLHVIIGLIGFSFSIFVPEISNDDLIFKAGVFIGLVNIIVAIACWFKKELFRQVSLFLSITFIFPSLVGSLFCILFFFPYAQWSDTPQQSEHKVFYAALLLPAVLAIIIALSLR